MTANKATIQENTKTQTLLTCQTLVLRDKNVFLDALVYTMARESGNTRPSPGWAGLARKGGHRTGELRLGSQVTSLTGD